MELLRGDTTTVPQILAMIRHWNPVTQKHIHIMVSEVSVMQWFCAGSPALLLLFAVFENLSSCNLIDELEFEFPFNLVA